MNNDDMENENYKSSNPWKQDVLGALTVGWKSLRMNFLLLFAVQLILFFLESPLDRIILERYELADEHTLRRDGIRVLFNTGYSVFFFSMLYASSHLVFLRGVRGEKISIRMLLEGFRNYLNVVLATLLTVGLIGISIVFLIIPGIYVMCRLAFVVYLVMDEGMGPIEAIEGSWRLTRGHASKVFALGMANLPFAPLFVLLAIFVIPEPNTLILMFLSIPVAIWTKSALAALYLSISQQPQPELKPQQISVRSVLTVIFSLMAMALLIIVVLTFE